jgi:hypothetical protein
MRDVTALVVEEVDREIAGIKVQMEVEVKAEGVAETLGVMDVIHRSGQPAHETRLIRYPSLRQSTI